MKLGKTYPKKNENNRRFLSKRLCKGTVFTDLSEITYKRLPAMLADALPDDFGNALIDRYMADKGISAAQVTALDRLAYMGKRAIGALDLAA